MDADLHRSLSASKPASQQLTLVAAITHFDNICRLYDKYIVNSKETSHLVTFSEDRLRREWAKRCEDGETMDIECEAGKVNKVIVDSCRQHIEAVLKTLVFSQKAANQ